MTIAPSINMFGRRSARSILQSETAECGLACLAMVAGFHGIDCDMNSLRERFGTSSRGISMFDISEYATDLGLTSRAVRLEPDQLGKLKLPAILHWSMNHFVVLSKVTGRGVTVLDPSTGKRRLSYNEVSQQFTGVALELEPDGEIQVARLPLRRLKLSSFWSGARGLGKLITQILAASVLLQLLVVAAPLFLQIGVDDVLSSGNADLLVVLGIGFLLLVALRVATEVLRSFMLLFLESHMNVHMQRQLFRKLLRLPLTFFEKRHVGSVASRFDSVDVVQRTLTASFLEAVVDGITVLPVLCIMLAYSVPLTLVVLGVSLAYLAVRLVLFPRLREASGEKIKHGARRQSSFLETLRAMQTVKMLGAELPRQRRWEGHLVDEINAGLKVSRLQIANNIANTSLTGIENVAVIWIGISMVMDGAMTVGMLFAYISWKRTFSERGVRLIEKLIELRMLGLHVDRIADIALTDDETVRPEGAVSNRKYSDSLRLVDLGFRYSSGDPDVISNLCADIGPGESVAIVGPSGCGKTTLIKLVAGLLEPTSGRIYVGDTELQKIGIAAHRKSIGAVLQDDELFSGTIADNIALFSERPDKQLIAECAAMADIDDDIRRMPMGYRTQIGDLGSSLSGGQRQRILLARALYRRPRILLLDEATSHLDVESERRVNSAISSLRITRIIAAHRKETIASASRIIQLSARELPDELLSRSASSGRTREIVS